MREGHGNVNPGEWDEEDDLALIDRGHVEMRWAGQKLPLPADDKSQVRDNMITIVT